VNPAARRPGAAQAAVILVNLGTPTAPTPQAVRTYLREFLSDPRVVEIPRLVWWPLLNGLILPLRPRTSAAKYAAIWTNEGSPLKVHTERQVKLLTGYWGDRGGAPVLFRHAMRYGEPGLSSVLKDVHAAGIDKVLVLPLYPQYAASTTGSMFDAVAAFLRSKRNPPAIRLVKHFHEHAGYIRSLANLVHEHWQHHGRPDRLLLSFHGIPRRSVKRGDPYAAECETTARLLSEALRLQKHEWQMSFQSRFGRAEWLKPYTAETLMALGRQGVVRVDVLCPGFVSDCLETLEEIGIEGKEQFLGAGGQSFHALPCLNERDDWIRALCALVEENLGGWFPTPGPPRSSVRGG
jgi:protoporphyrin/coproporphyrin ferrochelatase